MRQEAVAIENLPHPIAKERRKLSGIKAIGLRHPGAASARNAGSSASGGLIADFKKRQTQFQDGLKMTQIIFQ